MDPADLGPSDSFESQPNSPISNEEFLSQLAGKEIERLLAEVDQQLDAAMGIIREENPAPALVLRKYPQPEHVSEQETGLSQVFHRIAASTEEHDDDPSAELGRDEMEMLGTPVEVFERVTGVEARQAQRVDLFPDFKQETPAVLKPLEWVNAPFEGISQATLGAIGKVAIVSFASAIALLAYVIVVIR